MKRLLACWTCALLLVTGGADAQERYPSRVVRLVVPFAVGGSTDVLARALAQQLGERIGQPVVVENRPGAGGTVGTEYVAKQPPDGYTLLLGTVSTHSVAVSLYDKLGYDPVRDFAPITEIATIPNLVVVNADVTKVHTLAEFIALAKRQPGALVVRVERAGDVEPPRVRAPEDRRRHQPHPRPVQGLGPGAQRPPRRPGRDDDGRRDDVLSARQGGQADGARRHRHHALAAAARRADGRRAGLPRLRGDGVVRRVRAGAHAARPSSITSTASSSRRSAARS